jgi:outer membrane protein assembly factor BamB
LKDGLLYGLATAGKGATNLFCMDARTGDELWTDKTARGECGAVLDAGSVLLALTSDSNLVAFKPSNKEYLEVAKIKVADTPSWAYPIVTGNRVFVKDRDSVILWAIE